MGDNTKGKLRARQERFCREYLVDFNGTQAAIRSGYSKKTAAATATENLRKQKIIDRINELKKPMQEKVQINAEYLLKRLVDQDQARIEDLYNDDGSLKPVHEFPDAWQRGLVSGIEVVELFEHDENGKKVKIGYTSKVKLADRIRVQDMIGKHVDIQAWLDKQEISGDLTLSERMKKARERKRS